MDRPEAGLEKQLFGWDSAIPVFEVNVPHLSSLIQPEFIDGQSSECGEVLVVEGRVVK